jgi:Tol biopolymer transport system component
MNVEFLPAIALALPASLLMAGTARAQAPTTTRVSVATGGVQANQHSDAASISADGRLVAFRSGASNLVSGDTNQCLDIFVRDRISGITERVSVATGGAQANGDSYPPVISADGRFVAFESLATNLVAGDTNNVPDVFVHDRITGTTERVSVDSAGMEADCYSASPSISADGRLVAFASCAANLVAGDTNADFDVFLRDRVTGTTELVSVNSAGAQMNDWTGWPSISADGRYVALWSDASNAVAGDTNGDADVFVRDRVSGTTERVSVDSNGLEANDSSDFPWISADGRFVAFTSVASNLVAGDTNGEGDAFVHDRVSGTTERANVDFAGAQSAYGSTPFPALSGDGRFVVFGSAAPNLVAGDSNAVPDVFVHDRISGTTVRVSVATGGIQANKSSDGGSISADGRVVVFRSFATNLVAGDTNGSTDVFVHDRAPQPTVVVYCTAGTSSSGCSASIAAIANPSMSHDHACAITVTHVEGQTSGVIFYGIDNAGFTRPPWAGSSASSLCVKQPVQRTPLQISGTAPNTCNGSFVLDWDAYQAAHPFALGNPWSLGDKVYAQAWFRDPFAPTWTNLSNALELTYVP